MEETVKKIELYKKVKQQEVKIMSILESRKNITDKEFSELEEVKELKTLKDELKKLYD